jgi:hypothetical protein
MTNQPEQLELDLEFPTYTHYTVALAKGAVGEMVILRKHTARDVDSAINFIESLRDNAANRDNVTWQHDEVDAAGTMFGLAPGGVVFEISVVPPLTTELSK